MQMSTAIASPLVLGAFCAVGVLLGAATSVLAQPGDTATPQIDNCKNVCGECEDDWDRCCCNAGGACVETTSA